MHVTRSHTNVGLLALCQALQICGTSIVVATAPLVGATIAENQALITLPHALQWTAVALTAIPASMFMRKYGRRPGFMTGAAINMVAGTLAALAVMRSDFVLFTIAVTLLGVGNGFAIFYRFAAAETAGEAWRAKAISFVIGGGLVAAFAGPELAKASKDVLYPAVFAGTYLCVVAIAATVFLINIAIKLPKPDAPIKSATGKRDTGRPLGEIARQPNYVIAVMSAMIGWAVMVLMMTVTPVAMVANGHSFSDSAFVIEWHLVGMFAPSFITGTLLRRYGIPNIMLIGVALQAMAVTANFMGIDVWNFWFANMAQGVGWNFLFVGGTTLVTTTYRPEERAKAQALNDFLVYGTAATASFLSGFLNYAAGWSAVNIGIVPLIVMALALSFWLRTQPRPDLSATPTIAA